MFNYIPKKYSSYIFDLTAKYQKIYGFKIGTGEHATHNNEADAFKQCSLNLFFGFKYYLNILRSVIPNIKNC